MQYKGGRPGQRGLWEHPGDGSSERCHLGRMMQEQGQWTEGVIGLAPEATFTGTGS